MKTTFKIFFRKTWIIVSVIISILYLISCFTPFISADHFSFIPFFALAFPVLFFIAIIFSFFSFFVEKKLALLLLCIIPVGYTNIINSFAFNKSVDWNNEKGSNSLRVMTWNVQNFFDMSPQANPKGATRVEMLHLITEANPDILCLQEYRNVDNGKRLISVRDELDSLGFHFNYCSNDVVIIQKKRVVTGGVAVYSKKPFTDSGKIRISKGPLSESLVFTDVLAGNKTVRIFTAHLASFAIFGDTAQAFDEGEDIYTKTYNRKNNIQLKIRETEILHTYQINLIKDELKKSPYPVLFLGDLNTTPASYNYHFFRDDMQDAFLEKGTGIGATFYQILPTLRIDVCFADPIFQINQCAVINKKLSDHYPIITDVTIKQ